jgi:hypothetical protein
MSNNMQKASMKKAYVLFAAAILAAVSVEAGAGRKYGTAGCGLGSIVMGRSGSQVLAGTTNSTFYSQLFGITTGTSNCAEDGVAMVDKEKEFFANANYESLMQEIAQGKGENLEAMASLYGCHGDAFASSMKNHYTAIFPAKDTDSETMLSNMDAVVTSDAALQNACKDVN